MIYRELDTVVLTADIGKHDLRPGDVGTVVHVHSDDDLEVEFVRASGRTQALVTIRSTDVRPTRDDDLIAARSIDPTKGIS